MNWLWIWWGVVVFWGLYSAYRQIEKIATSLASLDEVAKSHAKTQQRICECLESLERSTWRIAEKHGLTDEEVQQL